MLSPCEDSDICRERTFSENSACYDRMIVTSPCDFCGQCHEKASPHFYDYIETVDSNLHCDICCQPLVDPIETNCRHTFCSKCFNNHLEVQAICPIDKIIINPDKCKPAPLIVRRLLDKLKVVCPNVDYCEEILPRHLLYDHLRTNCNGAVISCINADLGCVFQGSRNSFPSHQWECKYKNLTGGQDPMVKCISNDTTKSGCNNNQEREVDKVAEGNYFEVELTRPAGSRLGFSFVGGVDTALGCIIIQEIYLEGLLHKAHKCRPGDELLKVNDIDLTCVTHAEAIHILTSSSSKLKLQVHRLTNPEATGRQVFSVTLTKQNDKQLGLVLQPKKGHRGIYIRNCITGSEADRCGFLSIGDRIVQINGIEVRDSSQDEVFEIIKEAGVKVTFVIERHLNRTHVLRHSGDVQSTQTPRESDEEGSRSTSVESLRWGNSGFDHNSVVHSDENYNHSYGKKLRRSIVQIKKLPNEMLSITVAGGQQSTKRGTPIYINSIYPNSVIGRQHPQIRNGTILLAINQQCLLNLSHEVATKTISEQSWDCDVIELDVLEGPETCSPDRPFKPSWKYWLQLPLYCAIYKTVELYRDDPLTSLGFSVTGGVGSSRSTSGISDLSRDAIMVMTIVPGSLACNSRSLKCGDVLLEVDGTPLLSVPLSVALACLRRPSRRVSLTLLSWPGTLV